MDVFFENGTYFIFPVQILDLDSFINTMNRDKNWEAHPKNEPIFETFYLLQYAREMLVPQNGNMRAFHYKSVESLNICTFKRYIEERLCEMLHDIPKLSEVSCYVFATGIAFLEFKVLYGKMSLDEIVEYIYLFRSLRNDELKYAEYYEPTQISVKTAIKKVLENSWDFVKVCFSNPSEIKSQADIFTMIHTENASNPIRTNDEIMKYRYWLANGYNTRFNFAPIENKEKYEEKYNLAYSTSTEHHWGGTQDGIVCLSVNPFTFFYRQLCSDYHFMYLILLNHRFTSLQYVYELSKENSRFEEIEKMHEKIVRLKAQYTFRIISDDRVIQNIYHELFQVLELDELAKDIEEENERIIQLKQSELIKHEKKTERALVGLSVLTIVSALTDLASFMDRFPISHSVASWISGAVIAVAGGVIIANIIRR